jgi:hypothetical protein
MHSAFPRKDEKHAFKPGIRDSIRHGLSRIMRTCQGNQRVFGVLVLFLLLCMILLWGRRRGESDLYAPVVLVVVLDERDAVGDQVRIIDKILENRWEYASAHGTFFPGRKLTQTMNWQYSMPRISLIILKMSITGSNYPLSATQWLSIPTQNGSGISTRYACQEF